MSEEPKLGEYEHLITCRRCGSQHGVKLYCFFNPGYESRLLCQRCGFFLSSGGFVVDCRLISYGTKPIDREWHSR